MLQSMFKAFFGLLFFILFSTNVFGITSNIGVDTPPTAPSNVAANTDTYGQISLSWDANVEADLDYYVVYRETSSTATPTNAIDSVTTNSFIDITVDPNSTYYYYITAVNTSDEESAISSEVSVASKATYGSATTITSSGLWSPQEWGDFDNDGDLDLLVSGPPAGGGNNETHIYINNGDSTYTFLNPGFLQVDSNLAGYVAWTDYNNDDYLDIVIVGIGNFYLYTNDGDGTFTLNTQHSIPGTSYPSLDWGDYDKDGDLDLLYSGQSTSGKIVKIYDNAGNGSFTENTGATFPGMSTGHVVWVDTNQDGLLDVTYTGDVAAGIYLNNGDKTFTLSIDFSVPTYTYSHLSWADYDNDGDNDFIITGFSGVTKGDLYINNGDGTFTIDPEVTIPNTNQGDIDWGDIDNDGDLDFMINGYDSGLNAYRPAQIYFNSGAEGSYTFSQYPNFIFPSTFAGSLVDVDKDKDLDVVLSTTEGGFFLKQYVNEANPTISTPSPINLTVTVNEINVDLNWDAVIDTDGGPLTYNIFVKDSAGATVYGSPSLSDSTSGFRKINRLGNMGSNTNYSITLIPGTYTWGVQSIDITKAGSAFTFGENFTIDSTIVEPPKNVVATNSGNAVQLVWNQSSSQNISLYKVYQEADSISTPTTIIATVTDTTFTTNNLPTGTYYFYVTATNDLNQESTFSEWDSVSINNVSPQAPANVVVTDSSAISISLKWNSVNESDITRYLVFRDTMSTGSPKDSLGAVSHPDTTFTDNTVADETTYYYYLRAEDDVEQSGLFSNEAKVTTPGLLFSKVSGLPFTGLTVSSTAWGDYDNDGDLDLVASGYSFSLSSYQTKLYTNNGNGNFTENTTVSSTLPNVGDGSLAWGDYDNDGDLDLVLSGFSSSSIITKLFNNNGQGGFTENISASSTFINVYRGSLAWGDYDNDGDLDLALNGLTSHFTSGITKLYTNGGVGNFTEDSTASATIINTGFSSLAWADYDNDGDLDLVVSGRTTNAGVNLGTKLYTNNGAGNFNENNSISTILTDVRYSSLAWGDYDGDGDFDLVVSGYGNNYKPITKLFTNNGGSIFAENTSVSSTFVDVYYSSLAWGDYDNDGDQDLVLSGKTSSGRTAKLYTNNGGNNFTENTVVSSILTDVESGSLSWSDYDNDGDLDLAISGSTNGFSNGSSFSLYENKLPTQNNLPSTPTNLSANILADTLSISWDSAIDVEDSKLKYNVFVIDQDSAEIIANAMSDTSNGYRRVTYNGNAGLNTTHKIINPKTKRHLLVGVQAIDGANGASDFATLQIFIGNFIQIENSEVIVYDDSTYTFSDSFFEFVESFEDSTFSLKVTGTINGDLFKDNNNDGLFDGGDIFLPGSSTTVNFSSDKIRYRTSNLGVERDIKFVLETDEFSDSLTINFTASEAQPKIEGIDSTGGWYLLSNPFTTTIGELLGKVWTQGAVNSDAPTGASTLYTFSQDSSKYVAVTTDLDTTKLDAGEGLLVYLFEDDDLGDGESDIDGGWPKTLSNYGSPFGENINVTLKNVDHDGFVGTSGSEGFALMGNPYGWSISADSVIATLKREDPFANSYVYLWDPVDKLYYLKTSGEIKPYQSFFVRTISSGVTANLSFDYDDAYPSVTTKEVPDQIIQFSLKNEEFNLESTTQIRFSEEADAGIDPFDGYYLGSYASRYANLYTIIGDQYLTINNLPLTMAEEAEFPIYLDATIVGEFELSWTSENIPEGWNLFLKDVSTGAITDLGSEVSYTFNVGNRAKKADNSPKFGVANMSVKGKQNIEPQFMLTVRPAVVSNEADLGLPREVELEQNYPNPFNPTSVIRFGVPNTSKVQLEVFDILGRKVMTLVNGDVKQAGRYIVNFDGRSLASGMYIYRLVIGDKVLTKKMTLIK